MIEPSLDTWTTIFLAVVVHGVVLLSLLWFRKSSYKKADHLLAGFLLLFSLTLFTYVLFWSNYTLWFPHLLGATASFHFLYGPLLFFYILSIVKPDLSFSWKSAWHFLPFLIFLAYLMPIYALPASEKLNAINAALGPSRYAGYGTSTHVAVFLKTLHMSGYAIALFLMITGRYSFGYRFDNRLSKEGIRWMKAVIFCFAGFILSFALFFILVETISFSMQHDYMIAFAMSGFVFTVGYMGFWKPSYFQEAHDHRIKYESSTLGMEEAEEYKKMILNYMEEEKPYMDGDLRISDIAEKLSIPSHHVSQVINEQLQKNYYEFINGYRIDEAKRLLKETDPYDFKILRIALESGFNNKTSFNNAFKKEVGQTPSQFRKQFTNGSNGVSHHQ